MLIGKINIILEATESHHIIYCGLGYFAASYYGGYLFSVKTEEDLTAAHFSNHPMERHSARKIYCTLQEIVRIHEEPIEY